MPTRNEPLPPADAGPVERWVRPVAQWQAIDTPPPQWEWVLVYAADASRTSAQHMVARWDGSGWESADDGYQPYMDPTHWMLLPAGPMA